jgi:hypothetical protein
MPRLLQTMCNACCVEVVLKSSNEVVNAVDLSSMMYFPGLFLLIVVGGASMADWKGLEHMDWSVAPQALPIIFLALVYHDLTPGMHLLCSL